MTTNKPEVVAWRWRKPVVNDQGETVGATAWELSDAPGFLPWWTNDPLIRLSDYEALQVECEKLRRNAERYRWLRDFSSDDLCVVRIDYWSDEYVGTAGVEVIDGHHLDSDVDAARAAGGE